MNGVNVRDDTSIAWDDNLFAVDRESLRCAGAFRDANQRVPKAKCLELGMSVSKSKDSIRRMRK